MAALSKINVGTTADDGTGDNLRDSFVKTNLSFDKVDTSVQADGSVDMDTGYDPANDLSVATKEYVDKNAGGSSIFQFDYKWKDGALAT